MKRGITVYTDYDRAANWMLVIEKKKGKLTLDEITEAAREYDWDIYLLPLYCIDEEANGLLEEPEGDRVCLYRTDLLEGKA